MVVEIKRLNPNSYFLMYLEFETFCHTFSYNLICDLVEDESKFLPLIYTLSFIWPIRLSCWGTSLKRCHSYQREVNRCVFAPELKNHLCMTYTLYLYDTRGEEEEGWGWWASVRIKLVQPMMLKGMYYVAFSHENSLLSESQWYTCTSFWDSRQ